MIKIKNNTATREPLPQFLNGLLPVSLLDLSWTDPALLVRDCAWWPEEAADAPIDADTQRYGAEVLTLDVDRQVVMVSHEIVSLTAEEIVAIATAERKAITPASVSMAQARQQLDTLGVEDAVNSAVSTMPRSAQIDWEFRATVERGNTLVAAMAGLLGWSEADTDNYFIAAGKL